MSRIKTAEVAELLAVPVRWTTPKWIREDLESVRPRSLAGTRTLVLSDQPEWCLSPQVQEALCKLDYRLICPAAIVPAGAIGIDLGSSAAMEQSLAQLNAVPYDFVLALKNLNGLDALDTVTDPKQFAGGLLDLLFAVAKHAYSRLEQGTVSVGVLCLNGAGAKDILHFSRRLAA